MRGHSATIDLLCDGHVHTRLCNHAVGEMREYVQSAVARGLREIVFLEHLEVGIDYLERTWLNQDDFSHYFQEGERLNSEFDGILQIGLGVEVGYNPDYRDELLVELGKRNWDRVGISCHFLKLPATGKHLNLLSRKEGNLELARSAGAAQLLTSYFETLYEAVCTLPGTVLCHLDAPLRYLPELKFDESHYRQAEQILIEAKARGMMLEINTSGYRIRNQPFPASSFLKLALKHNLPLTAGSDAHHPDDVGNCFERLPEFIAASATCP